MLQSAKGRNRTDDTSIFSAVLYQLSYLGDVNYYNMSCPLRQALHMSEFSLQASMPVRSGRKAGMQSDQYSHCCSCKALL